MIDKSRYQNLCNFNLLMIVLEFLHATAVPTLVLCTGFAIFDRIDTLDMIEILVG